MATPDKDKDTPGNKGNDNTPSEERGGQGPFEKCHSTNLGSAQRSSSRVGQLLVG